MSEREKRLEAALEKIASEAQAVTNNASNVRLIWRLRKTARAALKED